MEIKISKSAKNCTACERAFAHEESYFSRLDVDEESSSLVRTDYCEACWGGLSSPPAYSTWSPRFYDPKVANPEQEEVFSPLRQLFYEAVAAEDRAESAKAFLAAQLLKRQKVFRLLKESDESDGEVKILLYTDRIGNRLIEVRDPNFTYGELDIARQRLMERLSELEAPPEEPPAEPTAEEEAGDEPSPEEAEEETEVLNEVEHATQPE